MSTTRATDRRGKKVNKNGRFKAEKPKKGKSPGWEIWSKRPGGVNGMGNGRDVKRRTAKAERREGRKQCQEET